MKTATKPTAKLSTNRSTPWAPIEDAIIGYLSWESRFMYCELGHFVHECGFLKDRSNSRIQRRYQQLQQQSALRKQRRWTKRQTDLLIEEWGDRAYTLAVARDAIKSLGPTMMPHPPEAVLCRIAATHRQLRYEQPVELKPTPRSDGRSLVRFLRSPQHFNWLELGQRRQALLLAQQGGGAVFAYLDLCKTPLAGPCNL